MSLCLRDGFTLASMHASIYASTFLLFYSSTLPLLCSPGSLRSCFHPFLFGLMWYSGILFRSSSFRVALSTSLSACKVVPFYQAGFRLRVGLFKTGDFWGTPYDPRYGSGLMPRTVVVAFASSTSKSEAVHSEFVFMVHQFLS